MLPLELWVQVGKVLRAHAQIKRQQRWTPLHQELLSYRKLHTPMPSSFFQKRFTDRSRPYYFWREGDRSRLYSFAADFRQSVHTAAFVLDRWDADHEKRVFVQRADGIQVTFYWNGDAAFSQGSIRDLTFQRVATPRTQPH
jgi:hypothetical protein